MEKPECPPVAVYQLVSGLMEGPQFVSRFVTEKRHKDGTRSVDFLPMIFSGETMEAAFLAATLFWASETDKLAARQASLERARAAKRTGASNA